ncbi:DegV family protein [Nesterenkonia alba]|uniref:DegV family protein n=1 Tax=Nesterenkonia alba TaxID=515814 RepID=UPI0003B4FBE7|nr:DegV family protein [Nesterenkonia alba]
MIAVVTDSAGCLASRGRLRVVSIPVTIGEQSFPEGSADLEERLKLALASGEPVSTSRPSPGVFAETYDQLLAQGYQHIVSVHLSGELSGTVDSARLGAANTAAQVHVVDSRQAGAPLGWAAEDAARVAEAGGRVEEVIAAAQRTAEAARVVFAVPSLERLRLSGRLRGPVAALGSLMHITAVLHLQAGRIQPVARPRTWQTAQQKLLEQTLHAAQQGQVRRCTVHHAADPQGARWLAERLRHQLDETAPGQSVDVVNLPPALSAHLGLGTLAVAVDAAPPPSG